jgi:hypothetical protein
VRRLRPPAGKLRRLMARKGVGAGVAVSAATAGAVFVWLFRGGAMPAGVETPPPAPTINLLQEWHEVVLVPGADGVGHADGADGLNSADINGDGLPDFVVPYEQGLRVSVSLHPGCALATSTAAWQAKTVFLPGLAPNLCSAEDAVFAKVDNDNAWDVVAACETGSVRVTVLFGPTDVNQLTTGTAWQRVNIAASANRRAMRVAVGNIAGDSAPELVVGGKENSPCNGTTAEVGYYSSATPRDGSSYTFTPLAPAGWVMNMTLADPDDDGDLDILYGDRERIDCPALDNTRRGLRWLRKDPSGYSEHPISLVEGDHKWHDVADWDGDGDLDVSDCRSATGINETTIWLNGGAFGSFTALPIAVPIGVGQCQHVVMGDLDEDGSKDLSYSYAQAANLSGLAWQKRSGPALSPVMSRGEISSTDPSGNDTKYDNHLQIDVNCDGRKDICSTEQHSPNGPGPGRGLVCRINPLG